MPNVLLFHCPNCDTIEPFKFHRKKNDLDGNHLILWHRGIVVCSICKHEESINANQREVPEWVNDGSRVYNPPVWNGERYVYPDEAK